MKIFNLFFCSALILFSCISAMGQQTCPTAETNLLYGWVGEWHSINKFGDTVAVNSFKQGDLPCSITEHRKLLKEQYEVDLITYYDFEEKIWKQDWKDSQGKSYQFEGQISMEGLSFESALAKDDDLERLRHVWKLTIGSNPSFRWDISTDNGQTWTDLFTCEYARSKMADGELANR